MTVTESSNTIEHKKGATALGLLVFFLVTSLAFNLFLAREVRGLRGVVRLLRNEGRLALGETVPSVEARDLSDRLVSISFADTDIPTVIYVFSPDCDWCVTNIPKIRFLASVAGARFRVVGLSLTSQGLRDHVAEYKINFPVYTDLSFTTIYRYKLGGTPQTILVSPEGRVLANWIGAFEGDVKRDIESALGIALPETHG